MGRVSWTLWKARKVGTSRLVICNCDSSSNSSSIWYRAFRSVSKCSICNCPLVPSVFSKCSYSSLFTLSGESKIVSLFFLVGMAGVWLGVPLRNFNFELDTMVVKGQLMCLVKGGLYCLKLLLEMVPIFTVTSFKQLGVF